MAGKDFTIFVTDDDANARRCLAKLLYSAGYNAKAYSSPHAFLDEHDWTQPGCVLLALRMKGLDGLQVQQRLTRQRFDRPIIFLAARCNIEACVQAMKAGAIDFLRKPVDRHKLLDAVERAEEQDARIRCADAERETIAAREQQLSPRQKEVLRHVIAGLQNRQIARALGIGVKTVKVHRGRVMEKMRASSIAELVQMTAKISLQPVELSNWLVQTVKRERQLAKDARQNKQRRRKIAKSANAHSDFARLPEALHNGNFCSSIRPLRYAYGPIVGLSSIRSTVS